MENISFLHYTKQIAVRIFKYYKIISWAYIAMDIDLHRAVLIVPPLLPDQDYKNQDVCGFFYLIFSPSFDLMI